MIFDMNKNEESWFQSLFQMPWLMCACTWLSMATKQIIRKNFWPQQARNRREDVQNLSIRDCAGLWGTYGKFACFSVNATVRNTRHTSDSARPTWLFQNIWPQFFKISLQWIRQFRNSVMVYRLPNINWLPGGIDLSGRLSDWALPRF